MSQQDAFDRILAALHDAALDDARWPATSALIDDACGARGNMLVFGEGRTLGDLQLFFSQLCVGGERLEWMEREYYTVYYPRDERIPRLRQLPDGRLAHVADLYTDREKRTSPAYNEALRGFDGRNGLNVRLDGPDGSRIIWSIADPVARDGWSSAQVETIGRLLPHVRQFLRVRQVLADDGALGESLTALLDSSGSGVIQLDRRGRIVAVNDTARDLLQRGQGLADQGGFLHARSPEDNAMLQRLLARALPPFGDQGASGSMMVGRSPLLSRLVLHVSPVGDQEREFRAQRVAALALIVDPGRQARIDPALVAATLGLTPAESQIAVMLAEGKSVRDIAISTGRRDDTIRWHMKHIFNKQGISRQVELVQLVISLAGVPGSPN